MVLLVGLLSAFVAVAGYCLFGNFREDFMFLVKIKPSEMAKLPRRLLIYVNHAIVTKFDVANMSFNGIRKHKILANIPELTVILDCLYFFMNVTASANYTEDIILVVFLYTIYYKNLPLGYILSSLIFKKMFFFLNK